MRGFLAVLILAQKGYHLFISPFLHVLAGPGSGCRFEPTCSYYAIEALQTQGLRRGCILIFQRFCRCHPWGGCGYDPVPQAKHLNSKSHGS